MISMTSAIIGRKVFEQENIPIFKLLRGMAEFRWRYEAFGMGIENFFFKIFRELIDKVISGRNSAEYDPFTHEFVSLKEDQDFIQNLLNFISDITSFPNYL